MSEEQKSDDQKMEDEIERRVRKVIKERDEEKEKNKNKSIIIGIAIAGIMAYIFFGVVFLSYNSTRMGILTFVLAACNIPFLFIKKARVIYFILVILLNIPIFVIGLR